MEHNQASKGATVPFPVESGEMGPAAVPVRRTSFLTRVAGVVWLAAVVGALAGIAAYSNSPGRSSLIPTEWPSDSRIPLDARRPTLVVFAHPHCPCTRATVEELDRLMTQCRDQVTAQVLFIRPEGMTDDWTKTGLWQNASAIPGVTVQVDADGVESRRFHAETSGQTMLYSPDGNLLFQGGITVSRGHAGDNPGVDGLIALLNHGNPGARKTPVFGCSLFNETCQQGDVACKP